MATMTKTEARRVVADLRRETLVLKETMFKRTPDWVLRELGREQPTEAQIKARVREHIKDLEDLLDELREYAQS